MAKKRFLKGLFKDMSHIDQPEGTWRYAKNAIINEKKGVISNEGGTELAGDIVSSAGIQNKVIGIIEVANDKAIILFLDNQSHSRIGKWEDGVFQTIYAPNITAFGDKVDLNFNINFPIEGTFNINPKGELLVYWTDDLNSPRVLNVTLQLESPPQFLYNINPGTSHDKHIDLLNLFPNSGPVPHINILEYNQLGQNYQNTVKEGGGLLTGVYYLSLAYVDDSYTATNFLTVSNPVAIVDEGDHTRPTTKKDGAPSSSQTSKAITWDVTNMNKDYKFLRPVIIRKTQDTIDAYRLNDMEIPISASNLNVTFSGIEGFSPAALEEIIIDTISYETAKTINQLDGVLYIGNTTGTKDLGYQKYANNIKLNAVTKTIENFDEVIISVDNIETGFKNTPVDSMGLGSGGINNPTPEVQTIDHSKSYRYAPNIFKYKGYTRDEVYAFYIAFIMNDGSMSYAYHIPGRENTGNDLLELDSAGWDNDFKKINPSVIRRFHNYDYSNVSGNRNMNYWQNATEIYPDTDNFDVFDAQNDSFISTLKNSNVRHHHFPSNGHPTHKTIHNNTSEVTGSGGLINDNTVQAWASLAYNGFTNGPTVPNSFGFHSGQATGINSGQGISITTAWQTVRWGGGAGITGDIVKEPTNFNASTTPPGMADALWTNNKYLVADQPMTVRASYFVRIASDGEMHTGKSQLVKEDTMGQITPIYTHNWYGDDTDYWTATVSGGFPFGWTNTVNLDTGDKVYVRIKGNGDNAGYWNRYFTADNVTNNDKNEIYFEVTPSSDIAEPEDFHDVKLSHTVKALGFELEDIKIPEDIANKIQGFRIYRAKRQHEDKRILGQGIITPMEPSKAIIGRCEETSGNQDANQILSTVGSVAEHLYSKDPWSSAYYTFAASPNLYNYVANPSSGNPAYTELPDERAMKAFSFNSFNLLRTQNSLAGATHIKPEYRVFNFVWNGPSLKQDRKMLSKIILDDGNDSYSEPIRKIEQFWGWDTAFNCYAKEIESAIFAGCHYQAANSVAFNDENTNEPRHQVSAPRMLGQKAKTYLPGDSIFEAAALGFGGKVMNEFGESSLIFSLKDNHEIRSTQIRSERGDSNIYSGLSSADISVYGRAHPNLPAILVNPLINDLDPYTYSTASAADKHNLRRSQSMMINLHAFKTDVYKSIDNQDLVWTGFEVIGDDLSNFIVGSGSPTFKTVDVEPEGIFGGDTYIARYGFRSTLTHNDANNISKPRKSIHYHIVESSDNINFRHTENDNSLYFPGSIAKRMLRMGGDIDYTHQDNLKYDDNFSSENDLRPAFPLPIKEIEQTEFPTRAHRSVKRDTTSLTDNYRLFLANEFKDIPKNRGELWKLSTFNNLLYFHMEESLYVTKGKQQMQMKDGSEAFVGSGDIFVQEPDEILQADKGYGGTQSQWAALTSPQGYFFVDVNSRKVFLMKDKLSEVSNAGMENWFKDNLPFTLEQYGYNAPCISGIFDNPLIGLGLTSVYDPKFKRILLTKKDLKPKQLFIDGYNLYLNWASSDYAGSSIPDGAIKFDCKIGQFVAAHVLDNPGGPNVIEYVPISWDLPSAYFESTGWTISYYPEFNVWCGFHDYVPYIYFNTSDNFYSIPDFDLSLNAGNHKIWKHNIESNRGSFYNLQGIDQYIYPFEIEYIHNEFREESTLLGSFEYALDTVNRSDVNVLNNGFTSFFIYNTLQISADNIEDGIVIPTPIEYLVNTRQVGNSWKINNFRDMAAVAVDNGVYYMAGTLANPNIIGGANQGTITTSSTQSMFLIDGMSETINPSYINTAKEWHQRRKFVDKWAGIRLIYNNLSNNLLNLYSAGASVRKTYK
tara:strand:- start:745 stop:6207 length:5463 start_codon:yes stop_codon:yes gene_type:complete